jgi:4'-phosphopantetheinyl transferase
MSSTVAGTAVAVRFAALDKRAFGMGDLPFLLPGGSLLSRLRDTTPARTVAWCCPPASPVLRRDEVHVWRSGLDWPDGAIQCGRQVLSASERERAERFNFDRDRKRFIARRAILRGILASYLNRTPSSVEFDEGSYGKPEARASDGLRFSVSDSEQVGLFAVSRGRKVGVDVERLRVVDDADGIVRRLFTPREAASYLSLPAHSRRDAFFAAWTRKEAYLKAIGVGLHQSVGSIEVPIVPSAVAGAVHVASTCAGNAVAWSLYAFRAAADYLGAVAVEGIGSTTRYWEWPSPRAQSSEGADRWTHAADEPGV